MKEYDYIIAGAGCAGLSLLTRLLQSGHFQHKKILLVDKEPKNRNDRTWCFWEQGEGFFEPVVYKSWQQLWVHGAGYTHLHDIHPYRYKMIRGIDLYRHCFNIIEQHSNVTVRYGEIEAMHSKGGEATLHINGNAVQADYIFNSVLFKKPVLQKKQYYLLQHFKGRVIETAQPVFNPNEATLMDFRIDQQPGTAFVYVMPFSATRALVEYTLFTDRLLDEAEYNRGLAHYIQHFLQVQHYTILEEEAGCIPMTNYSFPSFDGHIIHIGTAGGQTKASSGYTFQFIQKQANGLLQDMLQHGKPLVNRSVPGKRFRLYDSTLLNILSRRQLPGAFIFTELFRNNKATDILQFLDNETSLLQEIKIIKALPARIFLKAALEQLLAQ